MSMCLAIFVITTTRLFSKYNHFDKFTSLGLFVPLDLVASENAL